MKLNTIKPQKGLIEICLARQYWSRSQTTGGWWWSSSAKQTRVTRGFYLRGLLTCQKLCRSPWHRGAQHRLTARPKDWKLGVRAREEGVRNLLGLWFWSLGRRENNRKQRTNWERRQRTVLKGKNRCGKQWRIRNECNKGEDERWAREEREERSWCIA